MGSGKSTIGRLLSHSLQKNFVDLDFVIEKAMNKSVGEIFASLGEEAFRKLEHQYLEEICLQNDQIVSVGGGAPCFYENMEIMNKNGKTVYLKMSPQALMKRFMNLSPKARNTRPLLANKTKEELHEFISLTLQQRELFYKKATIIVFNEDSDTSKTVERIKMAL